MSEVCAGQVIEMKGGKKGSGRPRSAECRDASRSPIFDAALDIDRGKHFMVILYDPISLYLRIDVVFSLVLIPW